MKSNDDENDGNNVTIDDGEHNDEEEDIPLAEESVEQSDGEIEDDEKMDEDTDNDKENKSNDSGDGTGKDDEGGERNEGGQ